MVTAFVSEPTGRLVDRAPHAEFLYAAELSSNLAARLHAQNLVVVAGDVRPGIDGCISVVCNLRRSA